MKLTVELRARPEKTQELHQTLQALLPSIRKEKGCRDCRVWRDVEDNEIFFLAVDWETRGSLEQAIALRQRRRVPRGCRSAQRNGASQARTRIHPGKGSRA